MNIFRKIKLILCYIKNLKNMTEKQLSEQVENLFKTRIINNLSSFSVSTFTIKNSTPSEISFYIIFKQNCDFLFKIDFNNPDDIRYFIEEIKGCDFYLFANLIDLFRQRLDSETSNIKTIIKNYFLSNSIK